MHTTLRIPALVSALALAIPAAASAQECSISMTEPTQLFTASISIERAVSDPNAETAPRHLRDAARQLQDARRFTTNQLGYAFTKAQILIIWLHRDDVQPTMTLADLNLGRERNVSIDLVREADSLLTLIETEQPACIGELQRWRQSKPWNDRIAAAYRTLNANDLDSADYYAREAGRLDRRSPFLFNAYGQIALKRGQQEQALAYLDTAITLATADTSLADTRRQMRIQYGSILQEWGGSLENPDARKAALGRASALFLTLGHETPESADTPMFVSVGLDIAMMIQDSAAMKAGLQPMLANPAAYPDLALLVGAEVSRIAGNKENAIALYGETLKKNPNARDANYFLAYMLLDANRSEEAMPMLETLLRIDPSNGDNYLLKSIAVRNRVAPVTARRDAERDPARRQALLREIRAITAEADSLAAQEAGMQHKVQVIGFERRAEGAKLNGTIENRGRAARTYTVEMSFLNLAGEVLETVTVTTESIAPGATGGFEIIGTKAGTVAWSYKALQ